MLGELVSGGLSLVGGLFGSSSAKKAAREQAKAQMAAIDEERRQFDIVRQDQAPYREAGAAALNQLMRAYGLAGEGPDYSEFLDSPEYNFTRQMGEQAILRNASALGNLASGNTLAALTRFGQGLASQQFGNYVNRLAGLVGVGQGATNFTGQAGLMTGQGIADSLVGAGNARASGIVGSANVLADTLGSLGGTFAPMLDAWWQRRNELQTFVPSVSRIEG